MPFRLNSYGATDVGLKRQKNEDYFAIVDDEELFVLADGMGGHASGQVASRLATEHIVEFMTERCRQPGFQWPYPVHEGASFEEAAISNAIQYANERTFIESMKDSRLEGMGTTICAMVGAGDRLVLAHVGDSRIYRYRRGKVEQVTRDHSLLNHYLDTGTITPEEAKDFKNKNVIIRAVGLKDYVDPEVQVHPKLAGDVYMACSDGLSDLVGEQAMKEAFEAEPDLTGVAHRLIRLANQAGGKDNITCVLVQVLSTAEDDEYVDEGEVTDPLGIPAQREDDAWQDDGEPEPDAELGYGDTGQRRAAQHRTPVVSMPGALTIDNDAPTPRDGIPVAQPEPPRRRR